MLFCERINVLHFTSNFLDQVLNLQSKVSLYPTNDVVITDENRIMEDMKGPGHPGLKCRYKQCVVISGVVISGFYCIVIS